MSAPIAPTGGAEDVRADRAKSGDDPPTREVVVGVDGSEVGLGAVRWAAQEAARRGAPLRILHAAPYLGRAAARPARRRPNSPAPGASPRWPTPSPGTPSRACSRRPRSSRRRRHRAAPGGGRPASSWSWAARRRVPPTRWCWPSWRPGWPRTPPHRSIVVPRRRGGEPADRPVVAILGVGEPADDEAVATVRRDRRRSGSASASRLLQTRAARSERRRQLGRRPVRLGRAVPRLEVQHADLPAARANQVLGDACPSPLMVISAGHGTLLHRSLDGPHLWLLRHCTSPMALVPIGRTGRPRPARGRRAGRLTPRAHLAPATGQDRRSWVPPWSTVGPRLAVVLIALTALAAVAGRLSGLGSGPAGGHRGRRGPPCSWPRCPPCSLVVVRSLLLSALFVLLMLTVATATSAGRVTGPVLRAPGAAGRLPAHGAADRRRRRAGRRARAGQRRGAAARRGGHPDRRHPDRRRDDGDVAGRTAAARRAARPPRRGGGRARPGPVRPGRRPADRPPGRGHRARARRWTRPAPSGW